MIGERLLDLRKDAGYTQDELAAILNINNHSIFSYEKDRSEPPDEIKIAIAKFFNVFVDYLLGLVDTPSPLHSVSNYIRLPMYFPNEAKKELENYIHYIEYKLKIGAVKKSLIKKDAFRY